MIMINFDGRRNIRVGRICANIDKFQMRLVKLINVG